MSAPLGAGMLAAALLAHAAYGLASHDPCLRSVRLAAPAAWLGASLAWAAQPWQPALALHLRYQGFATQLRLARLLAIQFYGRGLGCRFEAEG
jgi:hypothetical protein